VVYYLNMMLAQWKRDQSPFTLVRDSRNSGSETLTLCTNTRTYTYWRHPSFCKELLLGHLKLQFSSHFFFGQRNNTTALSQGPIINYGWVISSFNLPKDPSKLWALSTISALVLALVIGTTAIWSSGCLCSSLNWCFAKHIYLNNITWNATQCILQCEPHRAVLSLSTMCAT